MRFRGTGALAGRPLPHGRGSAWYIAAPWCIAAPIGAATVRERFRRHEQLIPSRLLFVLACVAAVLSAQTASPPPPPAPTRADILRGEYGPYRANNDLLFYHLDVRVDPETKYLSGKNSIRFKMLQVVEQQIEIGR